MTDNCAELRDALRHVFPLCLLFLCIFHMLQQVWRWLKDSSHGVRQIDMPTTLGLFKNMVYAKTLSELENSYKNLLESTFNYANFQSYIQGLYDIKEAWACCYRNDTIIRGSNTNNFVESQFNVMKDGIIKRCREYNVNGLLEKIVNELDNHYQEKLLSVASGSFDGVYRRRFCGKGKAKKGKIGFQMPSEEEKAIFFYQI